MRIANRPADKTFHFGYHKVESFAALMAAIGMVVIGSVILYHSYDVLTLPHEIKQPILTMVVLGAAGVVSLHRAFQMKKIADRYDILSLKTDSKNSKRWFCLSYWFLYCICCVTIWLHSN